MVFIAVALMCASMSTPTTAETPTPAPAESVPTSPANTNLPQLIKRVAPAVVTLKTYDLQGANLGLGSGFLIENGRVVTNAHVVEQAARVEVYDAKEQLLGVTDYAESLSANVDLAVLPAMPNPPATLRLAANEPLVGESIFVIGAPQGLSNTVSTGIVSALRGHEGKRWIQITAPISQGSSGGPVLNHSGEVVGVSVAVLRDGQNLNFAVPIRDVKALTGSPPGRIAFTGARAPSQSLGPENTSNGAAPSPRSDFDQLLLAHPRILPGHPQAGELTGEDAMISSGRRTDLFTAEGKTEEVFTLVTTSDSFSPTMTVVMTKPDGQTEPIGHTDGKGAHIAHLVVRLRNSGKFGLIVSSSRPRIAGTYQVGLFKGALGIMDAANRMSDSRWLLLFKDKEHSIHLDKSTFRRAEPSLRKAWILWTYPGWESHRRGRYNNRKSLQEFDCTEKTVSLVSISYYEDTKLIDTSEMESRRWASWPPGSIGELVGETVCTM